MPKAKAKKKTTKKAAKKTKRSTSKKSATKKKKSSKAKKKNTPKVKPTEKIPVKLEKFLVSKKAKFEPVEHRTVYTTFDASMTLGVPAGAVAKTLLVQTDRDLLIVSIPGDKNLDFQKLKKAVIAEFKKRNLPPVKKVSLASEKMIEKKFTKSPGALPPFGALYDLPTFVDRGLQKPKKLILNAGSFTLSIEMSPAEYLRICDACLGSISKKR